MKKIYVFLIFFPLFFSSFVLVVDSDPITISDSLVKSDFLITKESDYRSFGFFNVVDPVVYESEVLCEGNLPLVMSFDKAVNSKSFFSSSENMKSNIDDISYVYQILVNESYIYKTPVYKTVKEIQVIKGNVSNGTVDKEIIVESQVVDYYKDNIGFRWVWKDIKSFESLSISKDKLVVLNVKGFFKPDTGGRKVDIVPCFTIGNEKQELNKYAWWNSSWGYKKSVTFNHNQVPSTQSKFPVLIKLSSDSNLADYAQNDGDDICFTNSLETVKLNHEIEYFNGTTGQLICWVNVTSLNSSVDTVIYMYYGNAICSSQQNVLGTWDSTKYISVYHMGDKTTSTIDDSCDKYDGTKQGANEPIVSTTGKIGSAQNFDGSDDDIDCSDINEMDGVTKLSMSIWYYADVLNENDVLYDLVSKTEGADGKDKVGLQIFPQTNKVVFYSSNGLNSGGYASGLSEVETGVWHNLHGVYNGSGATNADKNKLYLDGKALTLTFSYNIPSSLDSNSNHLMMGMPDPNYVSYPNNYKWWDGMLDEVRLGNSVLSSDWIKTTYNNFKNATSGGFFIIGSQETSNKLPVISNENPLNESVNNPLSLTWNCTIKDADGDTFNWSIECSNSQSISMNGASNGSKSLPLIGLAFLTKYYVFVNVTNGKGWTNESFNFWTMSKCPEYTNYSTNYSIWFCVNVSDDLDDIDFLNVSLYNNSQYKTWYAVHNGTFCVLFNNLTVGVDYIVNISVFDGFCWSNSSENININCGVGTVLFVEKDRLLMGLVIGSVFALLTIFVFSYRKRKR